MQIKYIKALIVLAIFYNSLQILGAEQIRKSIMTSISYINYHRDLLPQFITLISPTMNNISGWLLFITSFLQWSSLVTLLTNNPIPYNMTALGLVIEGLLQLAMGQCNRLPPYSLHPALPLLALGLGFMSLGAIERDIENKIQYRVRQMESKKD